MDNTEYLKKYLPPDKLEEGLKKLKNGEPVQYIIGNVNFLGNIINVDQRCLIPRFETEYLAEKIINYAKDKSDLSILDIGTGSGAIAISLQKELKCDVDGVDISKGAIDLARENNKLNKTNVNFFESDIFSKVNKKYDIIVSNPPYISYDEDIEDVVRNNEPAIALFAENNGLEFYEKILKNIDKYINKNGLIAFEIGQSQANDIMKIAHKYLNNISIKKEKDLAGFDRYIFIKML